MADRRRRRQLSQEILSEGESQQPSNLTLSESEHSSEQEYVDLSEFDSAEEEDEYYEGSDTAEEKDTDQEVVEHEIPKNDLSEEDVKDSKPEETLKVAHRRRKDSDSMRESGDGKSDNDQEGKSQNQVIKISEDEDSPFFIPTKGNFYQHDMRSQNSRGGGRPRPRNFNQESSKWVHDKYDDNQQAPKTREELVEEYGYDIRAQAYGKRQPQSNFRRPQGRRPGGRRGFPNRQQYNQGVRSEEPRHTDRQNEGPPRSRRNPPPIRSQNFRAARRSAPKQERDYVEEGEYINNEDNKANGDAKQKPETEKKVTERQNVPSPKPKPDKATPASKQKQSKSSDDMDDLLHVIHNREQDSSRRNYPKEKGYSHQRYKNRQEEELTDRMKKMAVSGPREATQPRRYSSLRQRTADPPNQPPRQFPPRVPSEWNQNVASSQPSPSTITEEPRQVAPRHTAEEVHSSQNVNNMEFTRPPANQQPDNFDLPPSSEITQEMVDSLFANRIPSMLNPTKLEQSADVSDPQRWVDSALAYQESLAAQSRAFLLSAALQQQQQQALQHQQQRQQASHGQLPAPNMLLNNEPKPASAPHMSPVPQSVNQDIGTLGSLVFPPTLPQNFPPSSFVQRNMVPETPIIPPNMPMAYPPTSGMMGQQVGGVTYYPNPLQPVQNVVPVNSPVGSPMRRLTAAIPIRPPMQ